MFKGAMNHVLAMVLMKTLKEEKTKEVIKETAQTIDHFADERFGDKKSEKLQTAVVTELLLPLSEQLLLEDKIAYVRIVENHLDKVRLKLMGVLNSPQKPKGNKGVVS